MSASPAANRGARAPRRALFVALAGVGACALLLTAWSALSTSGTERVVAGVHLEDMDVSRLTRAEIIERVHGWGAAHAARKISVTLSGSTLVFEPETAGFGVDADAAASRALAVGRDVGFAGRVGQVVSRWFRPRTVQLPLTFDAKRLGELFERWQSAIKDPPFDGGLAVDGTHVTPLYPRAGTGLDRARVASQLQVAVRAGQSAEPLATRSETPLVSRATVEALATRANAMLSRDVELATADGAHRLQISAAQLGSVLGAVPGASPGSLEIGCSPEATHALLEPQRAALEQAPQNARFVIDAQDHVRVEPGHSGFILDEKAVAEALCKAAENPDKKADLPLGAGAVPALSTEAAERAGVTGLMGTYTTRHACCQPRVDNIHHIADLLDNTLVQPGETFSVNQLVGPRTVKNGFRPAPSIEDGDMVDTVGGGVSQFATTLFNALFYGGYDILERQPHSYWFTRYPMGYDATLSYPHPDIVFKNDTDAGALIKTQYTDTTITVKIYGNNGGRRVRAEVSERQNIVNPPVELIPNRSLDADEEKAREGGMIGWSVTVKRILTFPDGKTKEERRKVTYKPRARRVEVHPCRIPAGEPGHTGERCPEPPKDDGEGSAAPDPGAK